MTPGRATTRFDLDAVQDPAKLHRVLNDYASDIQEQLTALSQLSRVAILDDVFVRIGAAYTPMVAPFPVQVQIPFPIRGATVILAECIDGATAEGGISTTAVIPWVRPVSGPDGQAMEILYISGLATSRQYRIRLAVFGVVQ